MPVNPLVLSLDGRRWACSVLTDAAYGFELGLFVNNIVLVPATRLGDLVMASFDGYHPFLLASWQGVFINPQGDAQANYTPLAFVVGAAGGNDTVYGYAVYNDAGYLLWSQLGPPGGVSMRNPGDRYPILLRLATGILAN